MDVPEILARAADTPHVRRVFGEPIERDGVIVVPVAAVRGGAGAGVGRDDEPGKDKGGAGFGVVARPAGVYVIRDGDAHWRPALDLNRVILGGQLVALTLLLVLRSLLRRRR